MKKQLILAATLFLSTLAMAQTKTSFGIRAGLSNARLQGDAVTHLNNLVELADGMVTSGSRTGFFAGTYASLPVSEIFTVEPAVYYAQKGYALQGNLAMKGMEFLGAGAQARLNLHYIDVPVLLKANINGFQVFAGPQVSYLAQADLRTTAGVLGINLLNNNLDATTQFNRWDAGVTGGIGYQFANGVNLTAAYDHGLSRVDANKSLNSYNRAFKVGVGFRF
jgi:hypothetical protein